MSTDVAAAESSAAENSEDVLQIRDLQVTFASDRGAVKAVDGVSFSVRRGEVLAVVGESGSGKTVTAKTILGLLPSTATASGVVLLSGHAAGERAGTSADVIAVGKGRLRELRGSDVAMVFQEPGTALNPVYTVGWQIAEGLRAHRKISRKQARAEAIEIMGRVGIPDAEQRVDQYPHQFSGGQKQRIVIAMALVLDPGLIVADEPTTALDVTVQAEILDLLRRCRDDFGASVLLITHNLGVVADLADRVAVMYQGSVVEENDVRSLFADPQQDYTKALLAAVPSVGEGAARAEVRARERTERRGAAGSDDANDALIVASRLRIQYPGRIGRPGFVAVDGVDLAVGPGEVLGLVGESGSGKTTIARAVAGLTKVTGGSLKVLGLEMNGVRERDFRRLRGDIGFVFQDPASSFNPLLTIAECVAEPLIVHHQADTKAARARVDEMLEAVQLPRSFGDRFPHELSGGQRQRASLARALVLSPKLVIADEPTSALDVSVQARVLELFADLQRQLGFASLFISHDLAVVDMLSDRIAVLYHGQLVEEGPGEVILGHPEHPYTQRLLASLPVPDPVRQEQRRTELRALHDAEA